jgi:hypothetical protein
MIKEVATMGEMKSVTVYMDQIFPFWDDPDLYGDDNLCDILVPESFLKKWAELTNRSMKYIYEQSTADDFDGLVVYARKSGVKLSLPPDEISRIKMLKENGCRMHIGLDECLE